MTPQQFKLCGLSSQLDFHAAADMAEEQNTPLLVAHNIRKRQLFVFFVYYTYEGDLYAAQGMDMHGNGKGLGNGYSLGRGAGRGNGTGNGYCLFGDRGADKELPCWDMD